MVQDLYHPDWYYKYYGQVFTLGREYDNEVNQINRLAQLEGKKIQEIGAGTGEHSFRLLAKDPSYLQLVDFDVEAVDILQGMFKDKCNVDIIHGDGFGESVNGIFDVVICMYSIVVQLVNTLEELNHRLDVLIDRLTKGGYFFVEVVDYDICKKIYEVCNQSCLFTDEQNEVMVRAEYSPSKLHFVYSGELDRKNILYRVSLLRLNRTDLIEVLESKCLADYGILNLDTRGRRIIGYGKT